MKNNRELMELAAKAANLKFDFRGLYGVIPAIFLDDGDAKRWEPLTDDGDALRLAVTLGLAIRQFSGANGYPPHVLVSYITSNGSIDLIYEHGDDALSATRRAIVLIAAEIGERMS